MEPHLLTDWLNNNSDGVETVLFYVIALLAIPMAYGVIFDRTVIRSGFLLIGVFGAISGIFLLLQAQFLAMAQIMIYAVGITLVVVIALMLTNPRMEKENRVTSKGEKWGAFFISLFFFLTIYMALRSEPWAAATTEQVNVGKNVAILGRALTTDYALAFEFASVLLLAALVGAIALAKAEPVISEVAEYSDDVPGNMIEGPEQSASATANTSSR